MKPTSRDRADKIAGQYCGPEAQSEANAKADKTNVPLFTREDTAPAEPEED